jgi:hypothetical protein
MDATWATGGSLPPERGWLFSETATRERVARTATHRPGRAATWGRVTRPGTRTPSCNRNRRPSRGGPAAAALDDQAGEAPQRQRSTTNRRPSRGGPAAAALDDQAGEAPQRQRSTTRPGRPRSGSARRPGRGGPAAAALDDQPTTRPGRPRSGSARRPGRGGPAAAALDDQAGEAPQRQRSTTRPTGRTVCRLNTSAELYSMQTEHLRGTVQSAA